MKKAIAILITLVILILFVGCSKVEAPVSLEKTPYHVKNRYYEIKDISKHDRPMYQYYIYGDNRELIKHNVTYGIPEITRNGMIIKLCIKVSGNEFSNGDVFCCRYFDIENNRSSIWFINPIVDNGKLVVYPDQPWQATKLIIQDIFDKSEYYLEFEREVYSGRESFDAEFINDGEQLLIKYLIPEGIYIRQKTETLDLY